MTVHQAKGMQWPAVLFWLRKNRFRPKRKGGRQIWHVIPESAVANADRYKGGIEDERRLFYVALTRAEKDWCVRGHLFKQISSSGRFWFMGEFTASEFVLTKPVKRVLPKATPSPRRETIR